MSISSRGSLSVIIPSYKSRHLDQVLSSLKSLEAAEILVVDSSPQRPILADAKATLVHVDGPRPPAAARNLGARRARGEYLLFIDSDVILPLHTVEWIHTFLENPSAELVSGIYDLDSPGGNFFSRLQNQILHYRCVRGTESQTHLFSSSHFLAQRKAFLRLNGFNEEMWTYEDIEFQARSQHLGYKPLLATDLVGIHLKEFTLRSLLTDYCRKAYNTFHARRRYRSVFRHVPSYVGKSLSLTWLLGALLPLVIVAALLVGIPWPIALAAPLCAYVVLSYPLLTRVVYRKSLAFHLKTLLVWPLIGSAVAAASATAAAVWQVRSAHKACVALWDFLRAARRVVIRNGMPVQLIAYVTARCNLRCEHCFYKETLDSPHPGELPLDVFERSTKSIGPVLFFSLDGPREIHDRIRGADSFDRVKATMQRLQPLTDIYPNLYLNVNTTVTEANAHAASGFIDELVKDFQPSAISINLFRYHSLTHPAIPDHVIEGYRRAVTVYEENLRRGMLKHYGFFGGRILLHKEILQKDLIYRVATYNEFVTPCTAGTLSYVIMEDGRVFPCEILPDSIGSVTESRRSFAEMTRSPEARDLRRWIRNTECRCTYECAMSTNTLFSWPMSKRMARAML